MDFAIVLAIGVFAGTVGGIVGTGASIILMPALVLAWGPQEAVPVMAIAAIMGNLGRVIAWRREVDWRAAGIFCVAATPGAALGVHTLITVPPGVIESALGVFFLSMVPMRKWLAHIQVRISITQLALLAGPLGFLTGIVVSTGPLTVPMFIAFGLDKGCLLGTEALASFVVYVAKVVTFGSFDALPAKVVIEGLITGSSLMAGSFIGRHMVLKLAPSSFHRMIDWLMIFSGATLLWAAAR
jgi:uncharacterized membrane protein YfcA